MQIVPVTSADMPPLSALARDTFTETFGHLYPLQDLSTFLDRSYAPEKLAAEVADPAQFWRMAVDDEGPAAYLHAGPAGLPLHEADPKRHGELKRLYVHSRAQGQGLGRRMLETALDWIGARYPGQPQWIGVWSENHKAQALYGAYGFVRVGGYTFSVGETLDDEFILRRECP